LIPVPNWKESFTVNRTDNGTTVAQNGFKDLLDAYKATENPSASELPLEPSEFVPILWIKNPVTTSDPDPDTTLANPGVLERNPATATNNVFTYDIGSNYTEGVERLGTEGYVNFNLKYVPLDKRDAAAWQSADGTALSKFFVDPNFTVPEWVIRNGINDDPQNGETNFGSASLPTTGVNWNGAAPFTVAYVQSTPPDGWIDGPDDPTHGNGNPDGTDPNWKDPLFPNYAPPVIILTDGYWGEIASGGVNTPIVFDTKGTFTGADWYYTIKETVTPPTPPAISEINNKGSTTTALRLSGPQTGVQRTVTIPGFYPNQPYDGWVIAVKDYVMSQPLFLDGTDAGFILGITW
jgi:hypothetical protein